MIELIVLVSVIVVPVIAMVVLGAIADRHAARMSPDELARFHAQLDRALSSPSSRPPQDGGDVPTSLRPHVGRDEPAPAPYIEY